MLKLYNFFIGALLLPMSVATTANANTEVDGDGNATVTLSGAEVKGRIAPEWSSEEGYGLPDQGDWKGTIVYDLGITANTDSVISIDNRYKEEKKHIVNLNGNDDEVSVEIGTLYVFDGIDPYDNGYLNLNNVEATFTDVLATGKVTVDETSHLILDGNSLVVSVNEINLTGELTINAIEDDTILTINSSSASAKGTATVNTAVDLENSKVATVNVATSGDLTTTNTNIGTLTSEGNSNLTSGEVTTATVGANGTLKTVYVNIGALTSNGDSHISGGTVETATIAVDKTLTTIKTDIGELISNGTSNLTDGEVTTATVTTDGALTTDGTTIGKLTTDGALTTDGTTIGKLTSNGTTKLTDGKVTTANIEGGALTVRNTTIGTLNVIGDLIYKGQGTIGETVFKEGSSLFIETGELNVGLLGATPDVDPENALNSVALESVTVGTTAILGFVEAHEQTIINNGTLNFTGSMGDTGSSVSIMGSSGGALNVESGELTIYNSNAPVVNTNGGHLIIRDRLLPKEGALVPPTLETTKIYILNMGAGDVSFIGGTIANGASLFEGAGMNIGITPGIPNIITKPQVIRLGGITGYTWVDGEMVAEYGMTTFTGVAAEDMNFDFTENGGTLIIENDEDTTIGNVTINGVDGDEGEEDGDAGGNFPFLKQAELVINLHDDFYGEGPTPTTLTAGTVNVTDLKILDGNLAVESLNVSNYTQLEIDSTNISESRADGLGIINATGLVDLSGDLLLTWTNTEDLGVDEGTQFVNLTTVEEGGDLNLDLDSTKAGLNDDLFEVDLEYVDGELGGVAGVAVVESTDDYAGAISDLDPSPLNVAMAEYLSSLKAAGNMSDQMVAITTGIDTTEDAEDILKSMEALQPISHRVYANSIHANTLKMASNISTEIGLARGSDAVNNTWIRGNFSMSGLGGSGSMSGLGGSGDVIGYDEKSSSTQLGYTSLLGQTVLGASIGYTMGSLEGESEHFSSDYHNINVSLGADYIVDENIYVGGVFGYANTQFETERNLFFLEEAAAQPHGDMGSHELLARVHAGYETIVTNTDVNVSYNAFYSFGAVLLDEYTEEGIGMLHVSDNSVYVNDLGIGVSVDKDLYSFREDMSLTPFLSVSAGLRHFTDAATEFEFIDETEGDFVMNDGDYAPWFTNASIGMVYSVQGFDLGGGYEIDTNVSDHINSTFFLTASYKF